MKTTKGKTKPVRKAAGRVMHIYRVDGNKLLAVVRSSSLKQGLLDYHKYTLSTYGYRNPKVVGNVMTVTHKRKPIQYRALEVYQKA
jgi:hypothetical protein